MSEIRENCPFCAVHDAQVDKVNTEEFAIWCNNFGAMGPFALSEEDAVERWNGRPGIH
ncbi:MAG: hypothetical protein ABFD98_15740 [Syntrophobacteraceae bacterium]|nr:hypothetical protein [Desulfobacteraceae bacterium]